MGPGLETVDAWADFLETGRREVPESPVRPPLKQVPAMLRRRLTPVSELVVSSWFALCTDAEIDGAQLPHVFASAHGEIRILENLLDVIHREESLSPTEFCHSVHHTATGYLSLITGNRGISRTVSAGSRTFHAGLVETMSLLSSGHHPLVVLTVADETVPAVFCDHLGIPAFAHAVSFVFATLEETRTRMATPCFQIEDVMKLDSETELFAFLRGGTA